jgi:hypothetical protein
MLALSAAAGCFRCIFVTTKLEELGVDYEARIVRPGAEARRFALQWT